MKTPFCLSPLEEHLFGSWSFEPVRQSIEGNRDTLITFGFQLHSPDDPLGVSQVSTTYSYYLL